MSAASLLLIALGGALGSVARALAGMAIPAGRLPWGTIAVNIVGSLVIGALLARYAATGADETARAHSFWVVGFCGGFTTFSAFSWQTFEQVQKGNWGVAVTHAVLSVGLCVAATWLGWRLAR